MKRVTIRKRCLVACAGVLFFWAGAIAEGATYTNSMQGNTFMPASRTIRVGDTVVWRNLDAGVSHSATGHPTNSPAEAFCGNTTFTGPSGFCSHTFANAGRFGYICLTHASMFGTLIVTSAPPNNPPSIALTNPPTGAKFAALAIIPLKASGSDTDGSITNVQFYSGISPVGSVTGAPYNLTLNNVAAGNYNFTAVARDNVGAAKTSAVVNVFVLTNAILTAPVWTEGAPFQLKIVGIAGQTYTTETSSNMVNWSAIATNVAPSNTFDVTDPGAGNTQLRFYRARQDL